MTPAKPLKPIPEDYTLKQSLPIIVENNNACVDNTLKLELLQGLLREVESVEGAKML